MIVEERSYLPAIFWKYGLDEAARRTYLRMTAPDYQRREYPEVSYAAIDALISGFMGVAPDYDSAVIRTVNHVIPGEWAQLTDLPVWDGVIDLKHTENGSTLTNRTGRMITWKNTKGGVTQSVTVMPGGTARL